MQKAEFKAYFAALNSVANEARLKLLLTSAQDKCFLRKPGIVVEYRSASFVPIKKCVSSVNIFYGIVRSVF